MDCWPLRVKSLWTDKLPSPGARRLSADAVKNTTKTPARRNNPTKRPVLENADCEPGFFFMDQISDERMILVSFKNASQQVFHGSFLVATALCRRVAVKVGDAERAPRHSEAATTTSAS